MRRTIVTALSLLALAGCQKSEQKAASAEGTTASATAAAPAGLGMRKAGLWTQTINAEGMNQTMKMCMDAQDLSEAGVTGPNMAKERCSKRAFAARPGGWSFESVCEMDGGGTVSAKGTATGGPDGYTMDMTSTTTESSIPQANRTMNIKLSAKWEGPCPAGMKPGEVAEMTVNGMTIKGAALKAVQGQMK
jgi:hypothetical protein